MIELRTPAELDGLRVAGRFVADVLDELLETVDVGVNLLDLDHVVCGGPFWRRIAPVLRERIEALVAGDPALIPRHPVAVESSRIGEDVAAVGAGCLVLDQTLSPRPSALLIAG